MELVQWQEDYSVQIDEIDAQHKKFLAIINKLADVEPANRDGLGIALDDLLDYATYHFSTEERVVAKRVQPAEMEEHRKRHQVFINRMVLLKQDYNRGREIDPNEVFDWAGNWLIHHILRRDKRNLAATPPAAT
jgi:hemerythrin